MFIVMISTKVPEHLRGYMSRFAVEIEAGVFVGKVSRAVADRLWERGVEATKEGRLTQIRSTSAVEQGFEIRTFGDDAPEVCEFDGLQLVARRQLARSREFSE